MNKKISLAILAQIGITEQPENSGVQVAGKTAGQLVETIVKNSILLIFSVGAVATVMMFLWGALDWILSGGDKEKVANARKKIVNSVIGVVLLSLTFVILRVIGQVSGFEFFGELKIPSFSGQ